LNTGVDIYDKLICVVWTLVFAVFFIIVILSTIFTSLSNIFIFLFPTYSVPNGDLKFGDVLVKFISGKIRDSGK
jgi:hypothetical protein